MSGRVVDLDIAGEQRVLAEGVELAAYRIVEHALAASDGDDEPVRVSLRFGRETLDVEVEAADHDTGAVVEETIVAAREQVAARGGSFDLRPAGPGRRSLARACRLPPSRRERRAVHVRERWSDGVLAGALVGAGALELAFGPEPLHPLNDPHAPLVAGGFVVVCLAAVVARRGHALRASCAAAPLMLAEGIARDVTHNGGATLLPIFIIAYALGAHEERRAAQSPDWH